MLNSLKKIPVYIAAFSTLLLPNIYSQTKSEPELVTIAEIERGGKTIEYKASEDVAAHMKFLAGYASTLIVGYDMAKIFIDSPFFPLEKKIELVRGLESLDNVKKDGVISEEEIIPKLGEDYKCEVNKKLGSDLVDLISIGGRTYKSTRTIEEHIWAEFARSFDRRSLGDLDLDFSEIQEAPVLGLEGRMKAFAVRADKNNDHKISAEEYVQLRKEVMKKVSFSEFSSALGSRMNLLGPFAKKVIERNWDFVEQSYLVKVITEIYKSPTKFMEENFSEEERKIITSFNLDKEKREEIAKVLPGFNLQNLSLADKTFIYTMMRTGGQTVEDIKDSIKEMNSPGIFEKRVIREGPVLMPSERSPFR